MKNEPDIITAGGLTAALYRADEAGRALIVLNTLKDEVSAVVRAMEEIGTPDCSLLAVGVPDWNRDMTPWHCPPVFRGGEEYAGGADDYLRLLLDMVIPETLDRLGTAPRFTGIAGYSLAGLFALYALYRCDAFGRAASMSGSLWFPGFAEYAAEHEPVRHPDRVYLSLGDREAATRNPYLKTVAESTGTVADLFGKQDVEVIRETNPGNHFRDAALRSAKGIRALLI
ncbi:MAG: alpha/beta hydrolase [Lachnospiraceae bacterium]|nr:alpha/beta hydrolase [Lachnospiraceae bacterium]